MSISRELRERFDQEALPHAEALFRFARRLTGRDETAEDLVQECFEKALRAFHQFKAGTNCKSWLFTILSNAHKARLRSAHNRRETVSTQEDGDFSFFEQLMAHEAGGRDNPEQVFLDSMPAPEVREAVGELSEGLRQVLLLCDVEGLSYQEIAETLDLPLGTVRSRLSRARDTLSRKLWNYFTTWYKSTPARGQ